MRSLLALGALALKGCSEEAEKKSEKPVTFEERKDVVFEGEPESLHIDIDLESYERPLDLQFDSHEVSLDGYSPAQFFPENLSDEKYREIVNSFSAYAKEYFQKNVAKQVVDANGDGDVITAISQKMIDDFLQFLFAADASIKEVFLKNKAAMASNPYSLTLFFNNFLLPNRIFFEPHLNNGGRGILFNLYEIDGAEIVTTSGEGGSKNSCLLFHIDKSYLDQADLPISWRQTMAKYNPENNTLLINESDVVHLFSGTPTMGPIRKVAPDFPDPKDIFKAPESIDPIEKHESTHSYLFSKYPEDKLRANFSASDKVSAAVRLRNGNVLNINGDYHPFNFHELAGIGMQLAQTNETNLNAARTIFPSYLLYDTPPTYQLVSEFLKSSIEHKSGKNYLEQAFNLSADEVRQIGEDMYKLGIYLLENREKVK